MIRDPFEVMAGLELRPSRDQGYSVWMVERWTAAAAERRKPHMALPLRTVTGAAGGGGMLEGIADVKIRDGMIILRKRP